jgi:hypothetical protein
MSGDEDVGGSGALTSVECARRRAIRSPKTDMLSTPARKNILIASALACVLLTAAGLARVRVFETEDAGPRNMREDALANFRGLADSSLAGDEQANTQTGAPSFDANTDLVLFPDERAAFIVGPQLRAGSARNPYPWFDRVAAEHGHLHERNTPRVAPRVLTGTLTLRRGSNEVVGAGTRFLSEVDPGGPAPVYDGHLRVRLPDGTTYRETKAARVVTDSRLVLSAPWPHESVTSAQGDTFHHDAARGSWNYDVYYDSLYYDLALVQYTNYYRTGDSRFLEYARKTADSWWGSPYIEHGTMTQGPNNLPPRSMAYAGLMLRALDGRPEMWDYLERQTRASFDNWVGRRLPDAALYGDLRETGYAQLYAVMLARVLPDAYALHGEGTLTAATGRARDGAAKRASLLRGAERAAVEFFGRLQRADGSWRWDVPGMGLVNVEQPFMVGLYLEAAAALHSLSADARVRDSLREQTERACRRLHARAYRGQETVADMPKYRWRGMWYFLGGGTAQNPAAYERGEGERATKGDSGMIRQVRHLNSTVHHAFGHAYAITNDAEFLRMGDEVFDASFGGRVDDLRGLADEGAPTNYAMNFRASGSTSPCVCAAPAGRATHSTPRHPAPLLRRGASSEAARTPSAAPSDSSPPPFPRPNNCRIFIGQWRGAGRGSDRGQIEGAARALNSAAGKNAAAAGVAKSCVPPSGTRARRSPPSSPAPTRSRSQGAFRVGGGSPQARERTSDAELRRYAQ